MKAERGKCYPNIMHAKIFRNIYNKRATNCLGGSEVNDAAKDYVR